MPLTPEEMEWNRQQLEEEKKRRAAEAVKRNQPAPTTTGAEAPSQDNSIQEAARTAKKKKRDRGVISQVGEALQYAAGGDLFQDAMNAGPAAFNALAQQLPDNDITRPIKGVVSAVDKAILSADELNAYKEQKGKEVAESGSLMDKATIGTLTNVEGLTTGVQAGVAIPFTVAARLANQDNPWSDPPAVVKDSPIAEPLFTVAEILTPTLLSGGAAAVAGAPALGSSLLGLTAESVLETATQDSFDDLLAGRKLAEALGQIAENQGYDGAALTRELIEGETVNSQVLTTVIGTAQNFGINFGADRLLKYFGPKVAKALRRTDVDDAAARVLGKSSDEVDRAVNDVREPLYDSLAEPHEVVDIDSAVPVSKPSKGKEFISDEALMRRATSSIAEDSTQDAGGRYMTNWSAVTDDNSLQRVMQEASSTLKRLKSFPEDMKTVIGRTAEWWDANKQLLDQNFDGLVLNFSNLTKTLEGKEGLEALLKPDVDTYLREYAATSEEGFLAASLVGEELGTRIQKQAAVAVKLEDGSIDFSAAIENILNLHDKLNLFLIPLRRGKRRWAVEGMLQQKRSLKRLKDADVQGAIRKQDPLSSDAASRSFEVVRDVETDPGLTLRELWTAFQEGDDAAGATLKRYLNLVAYTDPSTILSESTGLAQVLKDQLKKGNREAGTNLMYFSMLSRAATQTASAASNFARLVAEPLGAVISGDKAYGFGQLVGGWQAMGDGWKVLRKAIVEGKATNAGSKIDEVAVDLAKKQEALDGMFEAALKGLHESGATQMEILGAHMSHWSRSAANHPLVHAPGRLLMAADEWTKTIAANQVAVGRAYKEIAELGIKDPKQVNRIIDRHVSMVFRDSVKSGKIVDADVLNLAKNLTFQSEIPLNGNFVDNAFLGIKQAADNSGFWKFVSPFTRVSYNILETTARYEPTGAFRALAPKYKAIMAGEMGETAALQLKSQIAMGRTWSLMAALGAASGMVTGVNSGNKPKQSILIPADNEQGYIAIPYGKLEPFATITSVIADVVNGVRDDVISEGEYERFISNIVFSLGMASFDKTFMSGMADFGSMFDAKNLSGGSLTGAANITSVVVPGAARMVASWAYPYKTISGMQGNAWENFVGQWRARALGGLGNPIRYDELSGEPVPTVATAGKGDNYFALVLGSALNEFVYPGKITKAAKNDPVRNELDRVGFTHDLYSSLKTYGGIALNPTQQSILSKDMHDFGNLRGKLQGYFDSDGYKRLRNEFQAVRKADSPVLGSSDEGTRANTIRDLIHADIRAIYRSAKEEAATRGRLANDNDFQMKRHRANGVSSLKPPTEGSGLQGLLAWNNK